MSLAVCGSADLLRLRAACGEADFDRLARVLGYFPETVRVENAIPLEKIDLEPQPDDAPPEPEISQRPLAATPFWHLSHYEPIGEDIVQQRQAADHGPTTLPAWPTDPGQPPEPSELAAWRDLVPSLRRRLATSAETRAPDVDAAIRQLGRARALTRLPRRKRRVWGQTLTVIEDRSDRLIPYWRDQSRLIARLASVFPRHGLRHGLIWETLDRPVPADPDESSEAFWPPPPGSLVLVLGDLGGLAFGDDGRLAERWAALGADLREAGCRALALTPQAPELTADTVRKDWNILPWGRGNGGGRAALVEQAETLLAALALASRIEPGLLRDVRLRLNLPAAAESLAWQHPALSSRSSVAATLRADAAQALRETFWRQDTDETTQREILRRIHAWRGGLPPEVWFAEIQALPTELRPLLPHNADAEAADGFFAALGRRLQRRQDAETPGLLAWYRFVMPRLRLGHESDPELGIHFQRLYRAAFAQSRHAPELPGYDPALAALAEAEALPKRYRLALVGDSIAVTSLAETGLGSVLGIAESISGEFKLNLLESDEDDGIAFWATCRPPTWADAWGWDEHGAWVEFSVEGKDGQRVTQRMRWIAPGRFMMGSPETEVGRYANEGPQHEVTIRQGFWLFDTVCTQALWQAVTGDNPSHFKGDDRPVEQVSWQDAQRFMQALNERLPGLNLGLPSEAQWEYACRAGTTAAFSLGDNITPAQVNYNGDYPYAGGQKGEYRQKTLPVKQLPGNPWGLYQMHGNVREWTQDARHDNNEGAPADGSAWESSEAGGPRVLRGGSWYYNAGPCRAAHRSIDPPDLRSNDVGFRCARVQVREAGGQGASGPDSAPSARSQAPLGNAVGEAHASHGTGSMSFPDGVPKQSLGTSAGSEASAMRLPPSPAGRGAGGEGYLIRLDAGPPQRDNIAASDVIPAAPATLAIPPARRFQILTDRERLTLGQITQPDWAKAMGRDRFGLWADFAIEPKQGKPVVQRLRWIPPGRFLMGSPEDEPGRWSAEGPRHPVTIAQGFWLFDTPCTQALWAAVIGENPKISQAPSRFPDPDRPVEQVSWQDIHEHFLPALNAHLPGFMLPSEAQWEYACRAGTDTALYTGGIEILGDMDAPALDLIAWYGGNSGVDYDLPEGEDSTQGWWKDRRKQYEHTQAGTRKVKGKRANPWGLYDMLGNVWEWVEDPWHGSYENAPDDGSVWASDEAGGPRVLRGGSWGFSARYCRSAYRIDFLPDFRGNSIGFRCARVQA